MVHDDPEEELVEALLVGRATALLNDARGLGWELVESSDGIAWYTPAAAAAAAAGGGGGGGGEHPNP
jgi:hypothetical protein